MNDLDVTMARLALKSFLRDGLYSVGVVEITSKKIDLSQGGARFYPPSEWIKTLDGENNVVVLRTYTNDLIILHPMTYMKVMDSIEAMIRKHLVTVKTPYRRKESPLWPILYKFRGPWAAAKVRKERATGKGRFGSITVG